MDCERFLDSIDHQVYAILDAGVSWMSGAYQSYWRGTSSRDLPLILQMSDFQHLIQLSLRSPRSCHHPIDWHLYGHYCSMAAMSGNSVVFSPQSPSCSLAYSTPFTRVTCNELRYFSSFARMCSWFLIDFSQRLPLSFASLFGVVSVNGSDSEFSPYEPYSSASSEYLTCRERLQESH